MPDAPPCRKDGGEPPGGTPAVTSRTPGRGNRVLARLRRLLGWSAGADASPMSDCCDAERVAALEDRVTYAEAAIHHIIDRVGIDSHELPDPFAPRLHVPPADTEVPL